MEKTLIINNRRLYAIEVLPRPVGRGDLLLFQELPLDGLEEGMGHDLHEAALLRTRQHSVYRIFLLQP